MTQHWTTEYLGLSWVSGARGPDAYDCWGLLVKVYQERLQISLREHNADFSKVSICDREIADESAEWERLCIPEDMCAVALSKSVKFLHHVGIYLDIDGGLIMHSHETSGVVIQSVQELRNQGWKRFEYYAHCH